MVAYVTRVPAGFPGSITREDSKTVLQEIIDSTTPPTAFGGVVKLVSGKLQPIASGDAATVAYGFLARSFPTQSSTNAFGAATPPTSGIADVLRRGFIAVKLAQGTSAKGGAVFVRVTAASQKFVGDIETAADSGNCVQVPGAYFMGPADATGVTEVAYNVLPGSGL